MGQGTFRRKLVGGKWDSSGSKSKGVGKKVFAGTGRQWLVWGNLCLSVPAHRDVCPREVLADL